MIRRFYTHSSLRGILLAMAVLFIFSSQFTPVAADEIDSLRQRIDALEQQLQNTKQGSIADKQTPESHRGDEDG